MLFIVHKAIQTRHLALLQQGLHNNECIRPKQNSTHCFCYQLVCWFVLFASHIRQYGDDCTKYKQLNRAICGICAIVAYGKQAVSLYDYSGCTRFGIWLLSVAGRGHRQGSGGWVHAKLLLVLFICGYHHACYSLLKKFRNQANKRSHTWFRWFNEVPVILLLVVVYIVVAKPF